jgi:Tfp pilus assembly protein PilF
LIRINLGNVYLSTGDYEKALEQYESALKIQESSQPSDHPDVAVTLHNLAVVQARQGNNNEAKEYLERAEEIAGQTLSLKHPFMTLLDKTKNLLVGEG